VRARAAAFDSRLDHVDQLGNEPAADRTARPGDEEKMSRSPWKFTRAVPV
jgi:hypothetical protein